MDRKDQEILGVVIFVVGLLLFRRVGSIRRTDPIQSARYETNPWWPYYALRLLGMALIVTGVVVLFRA
jgi:uncharacterized protein YjeT (DUF2065 family)